MNFKNSIINGSNWAPSGRQSVNNTELKSIENRTIENDDDDDERRREKRGERRENFEYCCSESDFEPDTTAMDGEIRHKHKVFDTTVKETFASVADAGNGLYFSDGVKRVDFILVYHKFQLNDNQEKRRQFFQENLIKDGLELESEYPDASSVEGKIYCKIHAPWKTLCRQAEILRLKMPLKLQDELKRDEIRLPWYQDMSGHCLSLINSTSNKVQDVVENGETTQKFVHITHPFSRKKLQRFNIDDKNTFFQPVQRLEMVWEILQSARNDPKDDKSRGIESLLEKKVYQSAFPLHDGDCDPPKCSLPNTWCIRQTLRRTWARWGCAFKSQPLELIREYYGEKVGFYFAFLGFYTEWLIWPAIGGALSFIYGLISTSTNRIVIDFCEADSPPGNFTMCPMCQPPACEPFLMADEGCDLIKWDFRMDTVATLILACLSVIWATVFIKMWKRREAELAFEWDTHDLEHEDVVIRPDYEERATERRENPITRESEPYVPRKTRMLWKSVSVSVTLFMLLLVTAMLVALVLVRIQLYGAFRNLGLHTFQKNNVEWSRWTVHGLIFVTVVIFEKVYHSVALKLTTWECPKTQTEFISSFLWKVFLFELVNDFVPISYAAWFKGRLINTPLDLNFKSELCDPGGCLAEVVELISVLLLARLFIGNLAEVGIPFMKNFIEQKLHRHHSEEAESAGFPQYRKDYQLEELELDGVAEEYMEMIVQFAFVTLFVPAFPLAALVCFLNNIAEIRVDAINFVTAHRRPLPIRVPGIQIWNQFLEVITKLAILVNAALIAFTSELLPRLYYEVMPHNDSYNYGAFSMSTVPLEEFKHQDHVVEEIEEYIHTKNVTDCYYQDFRNPTHPYGRTDLWWHIMILRLVGFTVFVLVFFIFHWLFNFLVSDRPASVDMKIRRRKYVLSKATDNEVVDKWLIKKKTSMATATAAAAAATAAAAVVNGVSSDFTKTDGDFNNMQKQEAMQMTEINQCDDAQLIANEQLNSIGDDSNNLEEV